MKKGLPLVLLVLGCSDALDGGLGPLSGGHTPDVASASLEVSAGADPLGATSCRGSGMPVAIETLASGENHACTIGPEGDVYCWGRNDLGQLGQGHVRSMGGVQRVIGLEASAVGLAAGRHFTCGLLSDGVVACWGLVAVTTGVDFVPDGKAVVVFEGATALAAHEEHVCAVLGDGDVWCQTTYPKSDGGARRGPVRLDAAPEAVRLIAMHSDTLCAVTDSGDVWCGALSPNARDDSAGMVEGLRAPASTVVLGAETACALTHDYSVMCWPRRAAAPRAMEVPLDRDTRVLVAGDGHLCALNSYGRVYCWGDNSRGQAVPSRPGDRIPSPLEIPFDSEVLGLSAGPTSTCAHLAAGATTCWGALTLPQASPSPADVMAPGLRIPLPDGASQLDAGPTQTCAVLWDGTATCWGQTGLSEDEASATSAVPVANIPAAKRITVGHHEGCAVDHDGGIACWGDWLHPQYPSPSELYGQYASVAFGQEMSCAMSDYFSHPYCWGSSLAEPRLFARPAEFSLVPPFQTSLGYINDSGNAPVTVGARHGCVVREFMPFCWGDNAYGQVHPSRPTAFEQIPIMRDDLAGLREITAGARHTCALFLDGGVRCFGDDSHGQLGDGVVGGHRRTAAVVDLGGPATALSAGLEHTCAVRSDGRVFCWGKNDHGQLGAPSSLHLARPVAVPGITSAVSVAPGDSHTCVLLESGVVTCFGDLPRVVAPSGSNTTRTNLALWTCGGIRGGHVDLCSAPPSGGCDDGNPCTDDHCAGELGCAHVPRTGPCSDVEPAMACTGGQCVPESAPLWSDAPGSVLACDDPLSREGALCAGNGRCFGGTCVAQSTVVSVSEGAKGLLLLSSTGALHHVRDNGNGYSDPDLGLQGTGEILAGGVVKVFGFASYDCVIMDDGDVWCWGIGLHDLLVVFSSDFDAPESLHLASADLPSPIASLAPGHRHLCATLQSGDVACLGWNHAGQLGGGPDHTTAMTLVEGLPSDIVEVAVGDVHTCARSEGGDVWCLGGDEDGQVGDGSLAGGPVPHRVEGLGAASQLVARGSRTCAVVDGDVWCWGSTYAGVAGPSSPVRISGFSLPVLALGLGDTHACARLTDGSVECWGSPYGQGLLGNGRFEGSDVPVPTSPLSAPATHVAVGSYVTAALLEGGDVVFWGSTGPAIHDGASQRYGLRPQSVDLGATIGDATALFSSASLVCASGQHGDTACWGVKSVSDPMHHDIRWNWVGSGTPWLEPVLAFSPTVVEQVIGDLHECHRFEDGSVACSGRDHEGQLGNGEPRQHSDVPVVVTLPEPAVDLEAAYDATCAILESGALACWGSNEHGLMGNLLPAAGDPVYAATSASPRLIAGLAGPVRALSLSGRTACLIVESGDVYCAGDGSRGATGLPWWEGDESVELMRVTDLPGPAVAITTNSERSCAAFGTGGVTCWGGADFPAMLGAGKWDDTTRRMHVFGLSSPVISLRSHDNSTCALAATGRVVCWGAIEFERPIEVEYGTPWSPAAVPGLLDGEAVELQVASSSACVRTQKGAVKCWGNAPYGQLGDGRAFEPRRLSGIWPGSPSYYSLDMMSP